MVAFLRYRHGLRAHWANPGPLADGLRRLRRDRQLRDKLGRQGRESVHAEFSDESMARAMQAVYARVQKTSSAPEAVEAAPGC